MLDTDKIERLRHQRGLSQREAAERAGMSGGRFWNDVMRGRRPNVTLQTLAGIARALGADPRTLLKWDRAADEQ